MAYKIYQVFSAILTGGFVMGALSLKTRVNKAPKTNKKIKTRVRPSLEPSLYSMERLETDDLRIR
jgi:hypothetical protein